ncbi:hypothetical protein [Cellulomonas sp. FA1]|uniref:hypothetical protein n=1 Tax=Cellulomonas sp. FA1 TaxID=1346710 RepID=UPI0006258F28|nr:hypothetical protein [Cellulomonas sp. FA1]
MEKRDAIDDIIDIVLPVPARAPADADELTRAPLEAVREEVVRQREVFERYLRVADGDRSPARQDVLLAEIERARTEMREAEDRLRMLVAYGREFVAPQPYPLKTLAAAAGMSISGTRSAYTSDEVAAVAERTGRGPVRSTTLDA